MSHLLSSKIFNLKGVCNLDIPYYSRDQTRSEEFFVRILELYLRLYFRTEALYLSVAFMVHSSNRLHQKFEQNLNHLDNILHWLMEI